MKLAAGIDPGKQGWVVILQEPVVKVKIPLWNGNFDLKEIALLFDVYLKNAVVALEDIFSFPGTGKSSMFTMGRGLGIIEMGLACADVDFHYVKPKVWQKEVWIGDDIVLKPSSTGKTVVTDTKATSIKAAQRLFPDVDLTKSERAYVPDHNIADALLLAEYSRRILLNQNH